MGQVGKDDDEAVKWLSLGWLLFSAAVSHLMSALRIIHCPALLDFSHSAFIFPATFISILTYPCFSNFVVFAILENDCPSGLHTALKTSPLVSHHTHKIISSDGFLWLLLCLSSDNQAVRHRHCTDTWSPPSSHHADHGLCAAAVPEEDQHSQGRHREELHHTFLAGVTKTNDGWKLC